MTTLKGGAALIKDAGRGIATAIAERYTPLGAAVTVNYARRNSRGRRPHAERRRPG
jgi:NAD(P)-dependent dehydrogenase (short-subunit alcohol dehydrogenase family)